MIRRSRARSSSLFLMELILAILFFSVSSAVCMQFFVKSHLLSRDSNALNYAVNECTGIAEIVNTSDSLTQVLALLQAQYPDGSYPGLSENTSASQSKQAGADEKSSPPSLESRIVLYYNDSFTACSESEAAYTLTVQLNQNEQMLEASMQASDIHTSGQDIIYELETRHHIARRTGYEEG